MLIVLLSNMLRLLQRADKSSLMYTSDAQLKDINCGMFVPLCLVTEQFWHWWVILQNIRIWMRRKKLSAPLSVPARRTWELSWLQMRREPRLAGSLHMVRMWAWVWMRENTTSLTRSQTDLSASSLSLSVRHHEKSIAIFANTVYAIS